MAKRGNLIQKTIDELTKEGERIILAAYNRKTWQNRTYNLHDSYGSAVYYNGNLLRNTRRYLTSSPKADVINGRELGVYSGSRSRTQRGSSYTQFLKANPEGRFYDGDTIYAYGRDEVNKFLEGYKPDDNSGIELVVVAAMFYAGALEHYNYQVISSAVTELTNLANTLGRGVKVYLLDIKRDKDQAFTNKAFKIQGKQQVYG